MKNKFLFFPILLASCSFFIPNDQIKWKRIESNSSPKLCKIGSHDLSIIAPTQELSDLFKKRLQEVEAKGLSFQFVDKAVIWSLIQLVARPHNSSIKGRLQFVFIDKEVKIYQDAFTGNTPYFDALESLLKKKKSQYNLASLVKIVDQHFVGPYKIDEELSQFIAQFSKQQNFADEFNSYYVRGEDALKEDESLPKPMLSLLLKNYSVDKSPQLNDLNSFISYIQTPNLEVSCNYDLGLYDHSIFLLSPKELKANLFGLAGGPSYFMAASSYIPQINSFIKGTPYFEGEAPVRATPFCQTTSSKNSFWFMSTQGRDPVQHLHQLYQAGPDKFRSINSVASSIGQARHLFMTSPLRVAFEFQRSNENRRKEITLLNLPVYQADKLGQVWAWAKIDHESYFVLDDRFSEGHLCQP